MLIMMMIVVGSYIACIAYEVGGAGILVLARACASMCRRKRAPVIVHIMDSPSPTKHATTPFGSATRRTPCSATRAGRKRVSMHSRPSTRKHNTSLPNHCGYSCVIAASGAKPTLKRIQTLRNQTADIVKEHFLCNSMLGGKYMKEVVACEDLNLSSYVAQIRHQQWASAAELEGACMALNISMHMRDSEGKTMILNPGKKITHCIHNVHGHYMLWKYVRPKACKHEHGCCDGRAGMLPPPPWRLARMLPQNYRVVDINPAFAAAPPRITVFTDREITDTVRSGTLLLTYPISVYHLKELLAGIFELDVNSFTLHPPERPDQPLHDHADMPDMMIMNGGAPPAPMPEVTVHMENGASFRLTYIRGENHHEFLQRISCIIGAPTRAFTTSYMNGQPWIFPYDLVHDDKLRVNMVRGGMRRGTGNPAASRSRSISPTQPFLNARQRDWIERRLMPEPEYDLQEEHHGEDHERDGDGHGHHDRIRIDLPEPGDDNMYEEDPDRAQGHPWHQHGEQDDDGNDQERVPWEIDDEDETTFVCWSYPVELPPAQPNMVKRNIMDRDRWLAWIWAPPRALTSEIITYLDMKIRPIVGFKPQPLDAELWQDVRCISAPRRVSIECSNPHDLRRDLWEFYQAPRAIPIVQMDTIPGRIILSRELTPAQAQERIQEDAAFSEVRTLVTVGRQWLVIVQQLPLCVTRHMEDLEHQVNQLSRGGARRHINHAQEPRSAVITWSHQRAMECMPSANPQTVATLLRAQFRTATAIMAARSSSEVRESLTAAYRRAGLTAPSDAPHTTSDTQTEERDPGQETASISLDRQRGADMVRTMTTQTQIMTELLQNQGIMATLSEFTDLKDAMTSAMHTQQQMVQQMHALVMDMQRNMENMKRQHEQDVAHLKEDMTEFKERMKEWETHFLAEILARLPSGAPRTPRSTASTPRSLENRHRVAPYEQGGRDRERTTMEIVPAEGSRRDEEEAAPQEASPNPTLDYSPPEDVSFDENAPVASVLQRLQERSTRAMAPFRSRQ